MRIALMVIRLILFVPYYFGGIWWHGVKKNYNFQKAFAFVKHVAQRACAAGRVRLEAEGLENLPKEGGFLLAPNHQGLFDVVAIAGTCPTPLGIAYKKELANVPVLKQIFQCTKSFALDREDVRQSLTVIQAITKEVEEGRNYIIFPEGTRSKNGNVMGEFHGGSFRCAVKAKCPIIPIAFVDSFKVLDQKGSKRISAQIHYLKPIAYEEYQGMKAAEVAALVKARIQQAIDENLTEQ